MVLVSDFEKKDHKQPFQVMTNGFGDHDKWMTTQSEGAWLGYFFDKPIVMRGYGLRCCR